LNEYLKQFNHQGDILMEKLRSLADGKTQVTMFKYLNRATLDVIANVAFGLNMSAIMDETNKLNKYIGEALEGLSQAILDPLIKLRPGKYPKLREYNKSIRTLRVYARECILQRVKDMQECPEAARDDILSIIFKTASQLNYYT
jgi:cholesterol 24(S)-hydroxylase